MQADGPCILEKFSIVHLGIIAINSKINSFQALRRVNSIDDMLVKHGIQRKAENDQRTFYVLEGLYTLSQIAVVIDLVFLFTGIALGHEDGVVAPFD